MVACFAYLKLRVLPREALINDSNSLEMQALATSSPRAMPVSGVPSTSVAAWAALTTPFRRHAGYAPVQLFDSNNDAFEDELDVSDLHLRPPKL